MARHARADRPQRIPEPRSFNGRLAARRGGRARGGAATRSTSTTSTRRASTRSRPPRFFPGRAPGPFDPQAEQRRAHWEAGTTAPDVARELERLRAADLVVFQFPMWWHAQPGMLKGWLDRVLAYGGALHGQRSATTAGCCAGGARSSP
ncbi:MAG: NAD(P)H-dependent oxidoreductase [Dermatophilaceae bacterium]